MSASRNLVLTALAYACASGPRPTSSSEPTVADICVEEAGLFANLGSSSTDNDMANRVTWTTEAEDETWVEFSEDGTAWQATTSKAGAGVHDALVIGMPALAEVEWRARESTPDGDRCSPVEYFDNGALPASLPSVSLTEAAADANTGFTVTSIITETGSYVVILDALGRVVWVHESIDFVSGARLSADHAAVLYNTSHQASDPNGYLHRVSLDGTEHSELAIEHFHTAFDETDDGIVALAREHRTFETDGETREILGDVVVEVSWDGDSRELWSAFDTFEPDLSISYPEAGYPYEEGYEDWSHANGVSYVEESDSVLVTVARFDAVVEIGRQSAGVRWVLGSDEGDFAGSDGLIDWPHSARIGRDRELTIFNHNDPMAGGCAEAARIVLNTEDMRAEQVWSYESEQCMFVSYLGQALPLDDGSTLVIWSTAGQIDQASAEGELLWRVNVELGAAFGFGHRVSSLL